MGKLTLTHVLLGVIIILLLGLLFQNKIRNYFKTQDVLKRVSVFNIPDVALHCYKYIIDEASSEDDYSPECNEAIRSYDDKIVRWKGLINKANDIDCSEFADSREANDFHGWISGELSGGFYAYRKVVSGKEPDATNFVFMSTNKFDGKCQYDPYSLDTNHDCNACEHLP